MCKSIKEHTIETFYLTILKLNVHSKLWKDEINIQDFENKLVMTKLYRIVFLYIKSVTLK